MKRMGQKTSFLKNPQALLGAAGILLLGAGVALEYSSDALPKPALLTVVVKEEGFVPESLTVQRGDTVTFASELEGEFWPASDPHPVHSNLPPFDPKRPIGGTESWSYTFQELGVHYYHNHLDPLMKGKIVVLEEGSGVALDAQREDCGTLEGSAFDRCTYEKVEHLAEQEGVDAAFQLFKETYASGANLVCHWTAHLIGEVAFEEYLKGHMFNITNETSYCGYGFYHGFMELMLRENPDPALAISFCEDVGAVLGEEGRDNCYHGIGHGFTEEPPPQWTWGDGMAMAEPGLGVCERLLGDTAYKWETCATGVFTVIAGFHYKDQYDLSVEEAVDPFRFCREEVPERYQTACHGEFAPKLDKVLFWDVTRIPALTDGIKDGRTREYAIRAIVGGMLQRDVTDEASYEKYVLGCRAFSRPEDKESCRRGAVWGFWLHGVPEEEYKRMLTLCGLPLLTQEERSFCYEVSFERFNAVYEQSKVQAVCQEIPALYRAYCSRDAYPGAI
ncbi:MAG: hypothetical protein Q8P12_07630 [bacterium]|nr:hypothetical protein [bacterium]